MTKRESNKHAMYKAVEAVIDQYQEATKGLPLFQTVTADFKGKIAGIEKVNQDFAHITKGKTSAKEIAQDELIAAMLQVASIVFVYARRNKDENLKNVMKLKESSLKRMRDVELTGLARTIAEKTDSLAAELEKFGSNAETVKVFNERIEAYASKLDTKETGYADKSALRIDLHRQFDEADVLLKEELDSLVENFRESAPGFYDAYFAARSIRDLGIVHRKEPENEPENEPEEKPDITEIQQEDRIAS